MRLTVFGATGGIGQEIVRQGLAAGHQVTAVVRDLARLTVTGEGLEVFTAGIDDPETLRPTVAGRDAVFSGLGPRTMKQVGIASGLTRVILQALDAEGVRRFLVASAAPLGPVPANETFLLRYIGTPLISRILRKHYDDLRVMEDELRRSATDWTSVRPPKLVDTPVTGVYRTAVGANLRGGSKIGRADVAHAMLAMADDSATLKQAVGVAY
jgi:putative NADH-flavin reductase